MHRIRYILLATQSNRILISPIFHKKSGKSLVVRRKSSTFAFDFRNLWRDKQPVKLRIS